MKKVTIAIEIIVYAFIALFIYTSVSKLSYYERYLYDLNRSPMLKPFALYLSIIVPLVEIVVSVLLFFSRTRFLGLVSSLVLMIIFTVYVGYVLRYADSLPCTCGGLIRQLSWREHFVFNSVFIILAGLGIWLYKIKSKMDNLKVAEYKA